MLTLSRLLRQNVATTATTATASSETTIPGTRTVGRSWKTYWNDVGKRQPYPRSLTDSQQARLRMRKTTHEWRVHHGHGVALGLHGVTREVPDYEFTDGTPAPLSRPRYALKHFYDKQLVTMIRAAAAVERRIAAGRMPAVPGVAEQRAWDPEIPLFLTDSDEHGAPPRAGRTVLNEGQLAAGRLDGASLPSARVAGKTLIKDAAREGPLEPIELFASYEPATMFRERMRTPRPSSIWNRRRWNMSSQFLVHRAPRAKNTIPEGGK